VWPRSRLTRQAEAKALWQLKDRNFSQVRRELGAGDGTLRRLLEREIDEEALGFIQDEDEICLAIDEHSFKGMTKRGLISWISSLPLHTDPNHP